MKHSHYFKDVSRLTTIDVYRVLELFAVTDPCLQHAIKKLLVAGNRGVKNMDKDIQEAIDTLERWQGMRAEDGRETIASLGDGLRSDLSRMRLDIREELDKLGLIDGKAAGQ